MEQIELVDLVDSSGVVQMRSVPRPDLDTYPGLHIPIVIVVIFDAAGRMLVTKRPFDKKVEPSALEHICGAILSGEEPEAAALRETHEEAGVSLSGLHCIAQAVNAYGCFRYLFTATTDEEPHDYDRTEVEWAGFMTIEDLKEKHASGSCHFVKDFFENAEQALLHRNAMIHRNCSHTE